MTDKSTGYWKVVIEPPHEHVLPIDRLGRGLVFGPPNTEVGVGSIWVCPCGVELKYTGQPDGLFEETKK